jgi:hypothetical protein
VAVSGKDATGTTQKPAILSHFRASAHQVGQKKQLAVHERRKENLKFAVTKKRQLEQLKQLKVNI